MVVSSRSEGWGMQQGTGEWGSILRNQSLGEQIHTHTCTRPTGRRQSSHRRGRLHQVGARAPLYTSALGTLSKIE